MDSDEINEALTSNFRTAKIFRGIYAKNSTIPFTSFGPRYGIIINTAKSSSKGEHWLSIYKNVKTQNCVYFDSYGVNPFKDRTFSSILKGVCNTRSTGNNHSIFYSNKQLQGFFTSVCGFYCVLFLWFMSQEEENPKRFSFKSFLGLFDVLYTSHARDRYVCVKTKKIFPSLKYVRCGL